MYVGDRSHFLTPHKIRMVLGIPNEFHIGERVVNFEGYPPYLAVAAGVTIDTVCTLLPCSNWRISLGLQDSEWFSEKYKVPATSQWAERLTTFPEFLEEQQTTASLDSLLNYAAAPNTSLADHTTLEAWVVLIVLVLIIRTVKRTIIPPFSNIGRRAGRKTHGDQWVAENGEKIYKFGEYCYRLCFHSTLAIVGVYYFHDKPWWKFDENWNYVGGPSMFEDYPVQHIAAGMAWYYLVQGAYNLDAMITLLEISFAVKIRNPLAGGSIQSPILITWSETARGDFSEMMVHHLATNILIILSSHCELNRTGSIVLMLHDISDVPVDFCKLANFLKWKATTLFTFFLMLFTWMATRLYLYPVMTIKTTIYEGVLLLENGVIPEVMFFFYRQHFHILMTLLLLLHVVWFSMFLRMLLSYIRKNEYHDYSEHKSGEKDELEGSQSGTKTNGMNSKKQK